MSVSKDVSYLYKRTYLGIRWCLGAGLGLMLCGYLLRAIPIYFFWESVSLGWNLLGLGLWLACIQWIPIAWRSGWRKALASITMIAFLTFWLLLVIRLLMIVPQSEAYETAKIALSNLETVQAEVGEVQGFSVLPLGGLSEDTKHGYTTGTATLSMIVKGDQAYRLIEVEMVKTYDSDWFVRSTRWY